MAGRRASRARIRWLDSPADDPWPHTGSRSRPRVADRRSTRCVPMSTGRLVLGVEALRCGSSSPSRSTGRRAAGVCGGAAQGLMRGARCHAGISSRSPDSWTSAPRPAGTPGRCSVRGRRPHAHTAAALGAATVEVPCRPTSSYVRFEQGVPGHRTDIGDSSNPRGSGCSGMGSHTAAVGTGPAADRIDLRQTACDARSVPGCGSDVATAR